MTTDSAFLDDAHGEYLNGYADSVFGEETTAEVDITKPHWKCVCGTVAMPLEDSTVCKCSDPYDELWTRIDPTNEPIKQK